MVSLETVLKHNSSLKGYGPNLVAVFVGGTSGIGEATARAFVRDTISSKIYLVGRNEVQASKIIEDLRQINPDGQISFVKCDAARLQSVDEACKTIQEKEEKINLLFMSAGILTTKGPDETDEGIDKKFSLHYYSRMRFLANMLPQLTKAGDVSDGDSPVQPGLRRNLSSVVSVLDGRGEGLLIMDDLSLKRNYSLRNCATHAITMTTLSMTELAESNPKISFVHSYPGVVKTGLARNFGTFTRLGMNAIMVLAKPWMVPLSDSGERHLYAATSSQFPPRASGEANAAPGADGTNGSGVYRLSWDGSTAENSSYLQEYRKSETGKLVWKHTLEVFETICGKP
ncbi:hypothetical protein N7495_003568 [Penicillium taxi]|uniref:uncharacterized protein n=1 Tax=Penicillium taxi TaxID=168475 RepID=UPI002544DB86|nr:uncharacterized protein N7495_003568 [Penicillium taxi]KAJ5898824.1 hypothetical protein N7495_003568 [Penicillium taxi]